MKREATLKDMITADFDYMGWTETHRNCSFLTSPIA